MTDINKEPTKAEVEEWLNNLSPDDKQEYRRQKLLKAALEREGEPDWSRMGDGEFYKERMRRHGF